MIYEDIIKKLKSFNFTDVQRKKLAEIVLKLDEQKQDLLISGNNIATINGQSLLNGGDIKLLETEMFQIVTELPVENINPNKIYLLVDKGEEANNKYGEYLYIDGDWEKLGDFKAEIDLKNYVKKTDLATQSKNGIMSSLDKTKLDRVPNTILKRYNDTTIEENIVNINFTYDNIDSNLPYDVAINIPLSTENNAGLMSLEDKTKFNKFSDANEYEKAKQLSDSIVTKIDASSTTANVTVSETSKNLINGKEVKRNINLPNASTTKAGVITAEDKKKLDKIEATAQVNIVEKVGDSNIDFDINNKKVIIPVHGTGTSNNALLSKTDYQDLKTITPNKNDLFKNVDISQTTDGSKLIFDKIAGTKEVVIKNATITTNGLLSKEDKAKLDKIESKTQVNIIEKVNLDGIPLEVSNKAVNINVVDSANAGLMTAADKVKLDSISDNSQVNVIESVSINNKKLDVNDKNINIPLANIDANGAMSSSDKTKLDGIENKAQVNIIESIGTDTVNFTVTNKKVIVPTVTSTSEGLMLHDDKVKLDNIEELTVAELNSILNSNIIMGFDGDAEDGEFGD